MVSDKAVLTESKGRGSTVSGRGQHHGCSGENVEHPRNENRSHSGSHAEYRSLSRADEGLACILPSPHETVPLPALNVEEESTSGPAAPNEGREIHGEVDTGTGSSSLAVVPIDRPTADMIRVAMGFVGSLAENAIGKRVLQDIRYICDSFAFPVIVRHSKYIEDGPSEARVLKKARFECVRVANCESEKCSFNITVRTLSILDNQELSHKYAVEFSSAEHNHGPDLAEVRKLLPANIVKEADEMHNRSHIKFEDVVRFMEDKYGFTVDRKGLQRRMRWLQTKRSPKELDCNELIQTLMELRNTDIGSRSYMTSRQDNALQSVCWGLSHWRCDYEQFGILPGICIDCKANANAYSMNLVTISARTNAGTECTIFMGFLADETDKTFIWLLRCFKDCCGVDPSMIATDQQAACMYACRCVFPMTYLTLDDWHLNQNQLKNVWAHVCKIGRKEWNEPMNNGLFLLRRSNTSASFLSRRAEFEAKFFTGHIEELPKWYKYPRKDNSQLL